MIQTTKFCVNSDLFFWTDSCFFSDVNIQGLDYRSLALQTPYDCQDECSRDGSCYNFVFNLASNICYLKTGANGVKTFYAGAVSGPKKCIKQTGSQTEKKLYINIRSCFYIYVYKFIFQIHVFTTQQLLTLPLSK